MDPDSSKKAPAVRYLVKTINEEGVSNFEWMSCACGRLSCLLKGMAEFLIPPLTFVLKSTSLSGNNML